MTIDEHDVLITGGAGYIGSHLSRELLEAGADVAVLDDLSVGSRELVPESVSLHEVDVRSPEVASVLETERPTAVVHLAALSYVPDCEANPARAYGVNVVGTRTLLRSIREVETVETVVNASSAAVYPPRDGPLAEDVDPDPIEVYGKTKTLAEDQARLFQYESGVPTVTARIFNPYGPGDTNPHLIPAIVDQLVDGSRTVELGNLAPRRDYVHVRDVARALAGFTTFEGGYETFNVGSGTARSVRDVVERTADALGEEIRIEQDEDRMRESDRPHLEADVSKLRRQRGWEPEIGFVEGLRDLLRHEGLLD